MSIPCATTECKPLRAELVGSNRCTATGITTIGPAPVLALCRELLATGLDPDQPIEIYRGPGAEHRRRRPADSQG
jgi:hypothetical protein